MNEISFREQLKIWIYVALHSFGGPAGQISVIHKIIVEDKKLISEERFLHALNFCMLLPGPEAQQLATYMGWLMGKWRGGLLAGGLFILPGFLSILILSYLYLFFNHLPFVEGFFYGLKSSVIVIVLFALYRISKKSLTNLFSWLLALISFIALFFLNVSFPVIVLSAAISGIIFHRFNLKSGTNSKSFLETDTQPEIKKSLKTMFVWLFIWSFPMILVFIFFGKNSTFHQLNLFFSKMSLVTFGGAYAALSYVAQKAVEVYGWLKPLEMIDGLAMAEATPGPLIQSVQFVGFMGAYRFPDLASPYFSAFVGSILTTWMTFAPCFLWIFTFAPYVEFLRNKKALSEALRAITAAVVGVIFNLSLWFIFKTLFKHSQKIQSFIFNFEYPDFSSLDFYAVMIVVLAIFMQVKMKFNSMLILIISGLFGIIRIFFGF